MSGILNVSMFPGLSVMFFDFEMLSLAFFDVMGIPGIVVAFFVASVILNF